MKNFPTDETDQTDETDENIYLTPFCPPLLDKERGIKGER